MGLAIRLNEPPNELCPGCFANRFLFQRQLLSKRKDRQRGNQRQRQKDRETEIEKQRNMKTERQRQREVYRGVMGSERPLYWQVTSIGH